MTSTTGGCYTLLVALTSRSAPRSHRGSRSAPNLATPATVEFGAVGDRDLAPGWYAYTGSALGPGGFARIDRHRDLAAGERDARHWHVDYLLGHPDASVEGVVTSAGLNAECALAGAIRDDSSVREVPGIGASDCDCETHLAWGADEGALRQAVEEAHEAVRRSL